MGAWVESYVHVALVSKLLANNYFKFSTTKIASIVHNQLTVNNQLKVVMMQYKYAYSICQQLPACNLLLFPMVAFLQRARELPAGLQCLFKGNKVFTSCSLPYYQWDSQD